MIIAELPADEELRQLELASYNILDTQPEDDFNDLVDLASQMCNTPISLITLLDNDRQWFKAKKGLKAESTEKHISFCSHAILQNDIFNVEDATKDERFHDNPLVTGDLNIRFYAGAPIISNGFKLGTICIIDTKPKILTAKEENVLRILSAQVTKLLELRLKNKLIRDRAHAIIDSKSKTVHRFIEKSEDNNKLIAGNLHEDLAQTVASCILNLDIALTVDAQRTLLIEQTKEELKQVLNKMRDLSNAIIPSAINHLTTDNVIEDHINKIKRNFPFKINFLTSINNQNTNRNTSLVAVRVIEKWLEILGLRKGISKVIIKINTNENFELSIEDDGPQLSFEVLKKEVFDNLIYERLNAINGKIDLSVSLAGKNILKAIMPLTEIAEVV